MKVTRRTWLWSVVLVALLASCDRHPLTEEVPGIPGQDGMVQGMTPQGPEAGPLSTETPRILAPSSMAPVLDRSTAPPPGLPLRREAGPQSFAIQPFAAAATTPRIVWENSASGLRSIWFMNGPNWDGGAAGLPQVDPTWQIAGSGDFNGDAHPDLVWQHLPTGHRVIWYMNDATFTGQFADLGVVDPVWHISAVADFNNDGHPDLLWTHLTEGHRVIWFMNGPNYTGQHASLPQVDLSWEIAGAADFNGDTHPDILWQHLPTGQRAIWFMNGAAFEGQAAALPMVDPSWHIAGVADFNADGKPDLLWTHLPTGWRAIWLMNGAAWENKGTLLPVVPPEWRIAGTLDPPGPSITGPWTQTSAGQQHTCALSAAGQAYCWGSNQYGQLGDGTGTQRTRPRLVAGGHSWASLTAGHWHTCGITAAGDGYCWGYGGDGRLGIGSTVNRSTPQPVAVTGGDTWQILTAGERHTCGMTPDGRAYCWGHNFRGQLGDGTSTSRTSRVLVVDEHAWQVVSAGARHTCGVATTGDTYCWGDRDSGRLGNGASGTAAVRRPNLVLGGHKWTHVSAGGDHSCGITTVGDGYCWGRGSSGQRGDGNTVSTQTTPTIILNDHRWTSLDAGITNTCGITPTGQAYCWGSNGQGQIGNGTTGGAQTAPALVSGGFTWTTVDPGNEHACGTTNSRDAYCWGRGTQGQIGNGTAGTTIYSTPVKVSDPQ